MRIPSLLATIAALAVTAVACSSGDDDTTTNTTQTSAATTTSTAPTTTTPASTTTTTEAATTTTSNAPTSTTEATTSTSEPVDEVQEVTEDFLAMWAAFDAAVRDPSDEALRTELLEWLTGRMRTAVDIVDDYRAQGLKARRRDDIPASVDVEQVTVDDGRAELTVCELDSDEVVEIGTAPDGSDAVVNDSISSRRFTVTLEQASDRWLASDLSVVEEWPGELTCAAG